MHQKVKKITNNEQNKEAKLTKNYHNEQNKVEPVPE